VIPTGDARDSFERIDAADSNVELVVADLLDCLREP
jgi:hypothetical protein